MKAAVVALFTASRIYIYSCRERQAYLAGHFLHQKNWKIFPSQSDMFGKKSSEEIPAPLSYILPRCKYSG